MGTPLIAATSPAASLWDARVDGFRQIDPGIVGIALAAHMTIRQCLPQSDVGAGIPSGQHGISSGIAAAD